jgi:hypothetical protein
MFHKSALALWVPSVQVFGEVGRIADEWIIEAQFEIAQSRNLQAEMASGCLGHGASVNDTTQVGDAVHEAYYRFIRDHRYGVMRTRIAGLVHSNFIQTYAIGLHSASSSSKPRGGFRMNTQVSFSNTPHSSPCGRTEIESMASSMLAKDNPVGYPLTLIENAAGHVRLSFCLGRVQTYCRSIAS